MPAAKRQTVKTDRTMENKGARTYSSGTLIRRFREENKQKLQADAQEIMVTAMQRYAGDCAASSSSHIKV